MAMITLPKNIADVEVSKEFPVAPADTYTLEVKKVTVGKSQAGNIKIDCRCEIIEDPEYTGIGIFETFTLVESALFRLKQFCLAAEIDMDSLNGSFDPQAWVGETFDAVLDITTYQNKADETVEKNEVVKYIFDPED